MLNMNAPVADYDVDSHPVKGEKFLHSYRVCVIGIDVKRKETNITRRNPYTAEDGIISSFAMVKLANMANSPFSEVFFFNRRNRLLSSRPLLHGNQSYYVDMTDVASPAGFTRCKIVIEIDPTPHPIYSKWLKVSASVFRAEAAFFLDVDSACYWSGSLSPFSCIGNAYLHNVQETRVEKKEKSNVCAPRSATLVRLKHSDEATITRLGGFFQQPEFFSTINHTSIAGVIDDLLIREECLHLFLSSEHVIYPEEKKVLKEFIDCGQLWIVPRTHNAEESLMHLGGYKFTTSKLTLARLESENVRAWFDSTSTVLTCGFQSSSRAIGFSANCVTSDKFAAGYSVRLPKEVLSMKVEEILLKLVEQANLKRQKKMDTILVYINYGHDGELSESLRTAVENIGIKEKVEWAIVVVGGGHGRDTFRLNYHRVFENGIDVYAKVSRRSNNILDAWTNLVPAMSRELCFVSDSYKTSLSLPAPLYLANRSCIEGSLHADKMKVNMYALMQ